MKTIALAAAVGAVSGAGVVMAGTINYSSSFQLAQPINGAFNVVQSAANIWSWTGQIGMSGVENILVDLNGDGVMDTNEPNCRVVITDWHGSDNQPWFLEDSSGIRWLHDSNGSEHLVTPLVLPVGSFLRIFSETGNVAGGTLNPITLIGRVQNL